MNERLGFFTDSGQWFHGSGMTKGYWLADQVKASRSAYLAKRWRKVTRLLMADGEVLRTIPPAVASRDMNNITTTAWRNARELNTVRVDLQALQRLRNWLDDVLRVYDSGMLPHDLVTEFPPRDSIERLAQAAAQVTVLACPMVRVPTPEISESSAVVLGGSALSAEAPCWFAPSGLHA